ncbi:ATP-binding cassette domain-containing protein [Nitrosomonas sp.]|uniref:ATP-binding cassette domain-containing protein n=1 Tax=Nitrosomonas sp. TaxID=42353 RepID=UPI0025DFE448|nr:ATP-binding cassette domain-containing protein [Nitrosomonas sp.]
MQLYFRLLAKQAPYRKLHLLTACSILLMATTIAVFPLLIHQLLDSIFVTKNHAVLQSTILMIIGLFTIHTAAVYFKLFSIGKSGSLLADDLRMDLIDKLLALPVNQCLPLFRNDRIHQMIAHIYQVSPSAIRHFAQLLQDCLIIFGLLLCTLYLNQEFTILLVLIVPLLALIHRLTAHSDQRRSPALHDLLQHLSQAIEHHRIIRLDGGLAQESERLRKISKTIQLDEVQQTGQSAIVTSFSLAIVVLITIAVSYAVAFQAINGTLDLPEIGALVTATLLLLTPIQRILKIPKQMECHQKPLEAIFMFLDQPFETDTGILDIPRLQGKLVFEQVRYDDEVRSKPILNHINFTIKPGEVVVFKGYSTDEKTALIDLILRLQRPADGKIWLDDHLIERIKLDSLHANIAMVSSDAFLLNDKVAGNIAYGAKRCSNEATITAAAHASRAMEFIRTMPAGLQTQIDRKANKITRQQFLQLAIARAFVKNTPILILDEIFSLTDHDSGKLLSILETLMKNRTTLIFNQQIPQQLRKIDRIIVLENGSITENLKAPDSYPP